MREDGCDLRRHRVGRVRQVRADEDFKMPVRAQPIIPALANRLGLRASAGEADRHAHAVGQGGVQHLEQRGHARRHRIEPAFPVVLRHRFYSLQIACPAMAVPSAGTRTPKNDDRRGGQRESAGVVRAGASRQPGPADSRCWGEGDGTPSPHANKRHAGARRHDRAGARPLPHARIVTLMRQDRLRAWSERSRGDRAVPEGSRPILPFNVHMTA